MERSLLNDGGAAGLLCRRFRNNLAVPVATFGTTPLSSKNSSYSGFAGPATDFSVHNDVCCGYLLSYGSPEQKKKWLPRMVSGETICAIAMTEPGTGSDLQGIRTRAVRVGDEYVISGQKTFITNGQLCDLVIVVVRTNPEGGSRGIVSFSSRGKDQDFAAAGISTNLGTCRPIRPSCSSTMSASPSPISWAQRAAPWAR